MADNLLVILGVQDKEDVISNLLCYCFNTHQEFRDAFIRIFLKEDPTMLNNVRAYTRISIKQAGIPDIIIAGGIGCKDYVCIIENKLKAEEESDQTERYATEHCISGVLEFLQKNGQKNVRNKQVEKEFIFLTLFPDQCAKSPAFRSICYADIDQGILRNICAVDQPLNDLSSLLLCSLHQLFDKFYGYSKVNPDDKVLQKLREEDALDGTYLYFKNLLGSVKFPYGLELEWTFRGSALGRHYYGAIISKAKWHPHEMQRGTNNKYEVIDGCFNIHIEPQFDTLRGVLSLYLHYETNPYLTKNKMEIELTDESKTRYLDMRQAFVDFLRGKLKDSNEWEVAGSKNQVAKARLTVEENTTVNEFQERLLDLVATLASIIDDYISCLPVSQ